VDSVLSLDGSNSYDEDESSSSTSSLDHVWTCTVGTATESNYLSDCGFFGSETTLETTILTVARNTMSVNITYWFILDVTASDGRSNSVQVDVNPTSAGAPTVQITSTTSTINQDQKLTLNGLFSSNSSVVATWTAYFAGSLVTFSSLTKKSMTFTAVQAQARTNFPLAVAKSTFTGGRYYTFRLTVNPYDV
jgi:hypothetical protein